MDSKKLIKEIISWVLVFAAAYLLAWFINTFVLLNEKVPTSSMETTIMTGDRVMTYRLAYLFKDPKRGDIVVFPANEDPSIDYIKRIIGLPGEVIEGRNGVVYIDGKPLEEPYVKEDWSKNGDFDPVTVPEECYFVMGDNRNDSFDSRFWGKPFVSKDSIRSKAIFKYPKLGWLNKKISY